VVRRKATGRGRWRRMTSGKISSVADRAQSGAEKREWKQNWFHVVELWWIGGAGSERQADWSQWKQGGRRSGGAPDNLVHIARSKAVARQSAGMYSGRTVMSHPQSVTGASGRISRARVARRICVDCEMWKRRDGFFHQILADQNNIFPDTRHLPTIIKA